MVFGTGTPIPFFERIIDEKIDDNDYECSSG
jgi:hypothetical protein